MYTWAVRAGLFRQIFFEGVIAHKAAVAAYKALGTSEDGEEEGALEAAAGDVYATLHNVITLADVENPRAFVLSFVKDGKVGATSLMSSAMYSPSRLRQSAASSLAVCGTSAAFAAK